MTKKTLNVEKYISMKNEGLLDVDIAIRYHCSKAYVSKIKALAIKRGYTNLNNPIAIIRKEVDERFNIDNINLEDKIKLFLDMALSRKWVNEKSIADITIALLGFGFKNKDK
jgi:hypothetical protein